ncbi:MAG: sulfatase, partial [Bryobacteraceae bacterium]|nr:sulfatase [Bryobacteraceae bacterium]
GDPSPCVRIVAAEIVGRYGSDEELGRSLEVLIALADPAANGLYVSAQALNAIDSLGAKAAPLENRIAALPKPAHTEPDRVITMIKRLQDSILRNF